MKTVLGDFVRAARQRVNLSARELAEKINHSATWVYRIENGDRSDPHQSDLAAIAGACNLTPWETRYLYLLADAWPPAEGFGDQPLGEYLERIEQPTAWIAHGGQSYFNAEFRRLFRDVEDYRDMTHWHYAHPDARRIVINWEEIADWWVATGKLRMAADRNNPAITNSLDANLAAPDFRARWERQVIPLDPSNRIWHIRDSDTGELLALDMRLWRHPYRTGAMLAGFVRPD